MINLISRSNAALQFKFYRPEIQGLLNWEWGSHAKNKLPHFIIPTAWEQKNRMNVRKRNTSENRWKSKKSGMKYGGSCSIVRHSSVSAQILPWLSFSVLQSRCFVNLPIVKYFYSVKQSLADMPNNWEKQLFTFWRDIT